MRSQLIRLGVALALLAGTGACTWFAPEPSLTNLTYTPSVAGVVVAILPGGGYVLEGGETKSHVDFVSGGAAAVGDLLLAGDGPSTWGYAVSSWPDPPGCYEVQAEGVKTGGLIDADLGVPGTNPGHDVHLLLRVVDGFDSPVASSGRVLGLHLCLDRTGRVTVAN